MSTLVPTLCVSVRLHDRVVEERLLPVNGEVSIGEAADALVAFPGATLRIRRLGDRLQMQGHWLDPGRPLRYRRGPVEVEVEAVIARPLPRRPEWTPDLRLLVATAAVVLFGAFWESATSFVDDNAVVLSRVGREWIGERPMLAAFGADPAAEAPSTDEPDAPTVPPVVTFQQDPRAGAEQE